MDIVTLRDPAVSRLRKRHPLLKNKKIIGRGVFCRVFEGSTPQSVYKLTADRSHVEYLTDRLSPQGRFKPVVIEDYGVVGTLKTGTDIYLLEVERLQRLKRRSKNARLVAEIMNQTRRALPTEDKALEKDQPGLLEFMEDLNNFTYNFLCTFDLHYANFMERTDGTLIFSDPVFDEEIRGKHWDRLYQMSVFGTAKRLVQQRMPIKLNVGP